MLKDARKVTCEHCGHRNWVEKEVFLSFPHKVVEGFNPKFTYGYFIEFVPKGEVSIYNTRCFSGEWNKENRLKIEAILLSEVKELIPIEYLDKIELISKSPTKNGSPLEKHGTMGWKYDNLEHKEKLQNMKDPCSKQAQTAGQGSVQ